MEPRMNELLRWGIENSSHEELHRQALAVASTTSSATDTTTPTAASAAPPPAVTLPVALPSATAPTLSSSRAPAAMLSLPASASSSASLSTAAQQPPAQPPQKIDSKWIEAVLGKDDIVRMKEARDVLLRPNEVKETLEQALDELLFLVESIDNANDLHTIGALKPVIALLSSPHGTVRMGAAWVLATAAHNNLKVQKQVVENAGLPFLVNMLRKDTSSEARSKALSAISAILGHNPDAVHLFDGMQGFQTLLTCVTDVNAGDMVLQRKIAFILRQLVVYEEMPFVPQRLFELGFVKAFASAMATEDLDFREKVLSFLIACLEKPELHSRVAAELSQLGFQTTLESIRSEVDESPEKKEDLRDLLDLSQAALTLLAQS